MFWRWRWLSFWFNQFSGRVRRSLTGIDLWIEWCNLKFSLLRAIGWIGALVYLRANLCSSIFSTLSFNPSMAIALLPSAASCCLTSSGVILSLPIDTVFRFVLTVWICWRRVELLKVFSYGDGFLWCWVHDFTFKLRYNAVGLLHVTHLNASAAKLVLRSVLISLRNFFS